MKALLIILFFLGASCTYAQQITNDLFIIKKTATVYSQSTGEVLLEVTVASKEMNYFDHTPQYLQPIIPSYGKQVLVHPLGPAPYYHSGVRRFYPYPYQPPTVYPAAVKISEADGLLVSSLTLVACIIGATVMLIE